MGNDSTNVRYLRRKTAFIEMTTTRQLHGRRREPLGGSWNWEFDFLGAIDFFQMKKRGRARTVFGGWVAGKWSQRA